MPTKFAHLETGRARLIVVPELAPVLTQAQLHTAAQIEAVLARGGGPEGRAATALLALPGRPDRILLRSVRHGGWFGPVWGESLLGAGRALAELECNHALHARGAPVPRPALVAATRTRGPFWRALVGTWFEENARDALAFLAEEPSPERIHAAAESAGHAVRRFHDVGGQHRDLHLKNVLLRDVASGIEVCIIDLDRARVTSGLDAGRRMAELMRLFRSIEKRSLTRQLGPECVGKFFDAYTGEDAQLRAALLRYRRRERLRVAIHSLGYRR